jgi:AcrR family transcriptional regulator
VLAVAAEVFAAEGLSVPVHEIARRAGVGTGTVSRHFPTKEDLFAAILLRRMAELTSRADTLVASLEPGDAFFTYFTEVVRAGGDHKGLADALAGAGYDLDRAGAEAGVDVSTRLRDLLLEAQRAGAVRSDVTYADVKALMTGCMVGDSLGPLIAVVCQGLAAPPP